MSGYNGDDYAEPQSQEYQSPGSRPLVRLNGLVYCYLRPLESVFSRFSQGLGRKVFLKDVYRSLKSRGVYRVGGPDGDTAMAKFIQGDKEWFGDFPDKRTSIGGRLENFIL
jgi:hypothetical protein